MTTMTDDLRNRPATESSERETVDQARDSGDRDERRPPSPADAAAKPDEGGSVWQRQGTSAPDAADIEDPDSQL
jgi:hypothetical protein